MSSDKVCPVKPLYGSKQIYAMTQKSAGSLPCKPDSGIYPDGAKYTTAPSKIGMIDVEIQLQKGFCG